MRYFTRRRKNFSYDHDEEVYNPNIPVLMVYEEDERSTGILDESGEEIFCSERTQIGFLSEILNDSV